MIRPLLLLSILCVFITASAKELLFNHLTVEDGLPTNFNTTTFVDHYGYLWIGTLEGLDRSDGRLTKSFSSYFPGEKKHVLSLCEDDKGSLLIGTLSGLYIWNRTSDVFELVRFSNTDTSDIPISQLLYYGNDIVFFISEKILFSLNISTNYLSTVYTQPLSYPSIATTDFVIDDNVLFSVSTDGLFKYDLENMNTDCLSDLKLVDSSFLKIFCLIKHGDDLYLGASGRGLWRYSISDREWFELPEFSEYKIRCLEVLNDELIIGTMVSGVKFYNIKTHAIHSFTNDRANPSSLSSNAINAITVDYHNVLWISTHEGGINYTAPSKQVFSTYRPHDDSELINRSIRSLYFDDSCKFIGTRNGLLMVDPLGETQKIVQKEDRLGGQVIIAQYKYKDTLLVSILNGGLCSYLAVSQTLEPWMDGYFHDKSAYSFTQDSTHHLWVGTHEGLFKVVDSENVIQYSHANSALKMNCIYSIKFDVRNRLWIGGSKGVSVYTVSNDKLIKVRDIPIDCRSTYLYMDYTNNMWVCTDKFGVYQFDMDFNLIKNISQKDGLCNNAVVSILQTENDNFWFGTQNGLSLYNERTDSCTSYIATTGLPGPSFCLGASLVDTENTIWMGNEKGLVNFKPDDVINLKPTHNLNITQILVDGTPVFNASTDSDTIPAEDTYELNLSSEHNLLTFQFANITFQNNTSFQYCVYLEGQDTAWNAIRGEHQVLYSKLRSGNYVFKVGLTQNDNKIIDGSIRTVMVHVTSVWYARVWVILLLVFICALLLYVLYYRSKISPNIKVPATAQKEKVKYESSKLDTSTSHMILKRVQDYLEASQVFLNEDLRIIDVSEALNIPTREISQAINENLNLRFTSFINEYRIHEAKKRMHQTEYKKYTLQAIAKSCGFKSKTSFNLAFKKVTGLTPTEYLDK